MRQVGMLSASQKITLLARRLFRQSVRYYYHPAILEADCGKDLGLGLGIGGWNTLKEAYATMNPIRSLSCAKESASLVGAAFRRYDCVGEITYVVEGISYQN